MIGESLMYGRWRLSSFALDCSRSDYSVPPSPPFARGDAGRSIESLDCPALQRLLHKIEEGQIDHVVVHGIDRLARRIRDLSKLLDVFQQDGVELSVASDPILTNRRPTV